MTAGARRHARRCRELFDSFDEVAGTVDPQADGDETGTEPAAPGDENGPDGNGLG
jgi:hypothetical protein